MSVAFETKPQHVGLRQSTTLQHLNNNEVENGPAMELWDLIHAPKNRYQSAQQRRTLHHPSLPQPTFEEEQVRLNLCQDEQYSKNEPRMNSSSKKVESSKSMKSLSSLSLEERLASALDRAGIGPSSRSSKSLDKGGNIEPTLQSSPTSTLQFPVEPEPLLSSTRQYSDSGMKRASSQDFFWDYTSFYDDEDDQVDDMYLYQSSSDKKNVSDKETRLEQTSKPTEYKSEIDQHSDTHTFVVCADTQLGTFSKNTEWGQELSYINQAVTKINAIEPAPAFVSVCGDLVEMEASIYGNKEGSPYNYQQCYEIQDEQNRDFKKAWSKLDDRIPLVCLCGNHDVGNRPTKASVQRFKSSFGDDYLAFWTNGTYNIVMNNVLFNDPTGAPDLFDEQIVWLEDRLKYANVLKANQIFVFGHHPWFLYHEDEEKEDLKGKNPMPKEWGPPGTLDDAYFTLPKKYRSIAMKLFKKYRVSACFSGHFHQNVVSKTSWGMDMIITGPLSVVLESDGKPKQDEANGIGMRIVEVEGKEFRHHFVSFES